MIFLKKSIFYSTNRRKIDLFEIDHVELDYQKKKLIIIYLQNSSQIEVLYFSVLNMKRNVRITMFEQAILR